MKKQLLLTILIAGVLVVSSVGLARISNPSDTSTFLESPVGVSDGGTGETSFTADRYLYVTSTDNLEQVTSSTLRTLLDVIQNGLVDMSDDTNWTAGRSLTITRDDVAADAELFTRMASVSILNPSSTLNFTDGAIALR